MAVALHKSLGEGGERVDVAADAQGMHDENVGSLGLATDDHDNDVQVHFGVPRPRHPLSIASKSHTCCSLCYITYI